MTDDHELIPTRRMMPQLSLPGPVAKGSEFRRWVSILAYYAGSVVNVALLVVGTGLAAAGIATILDGFGIVDISIADDLESALAVGLVTSVLGGFAIGLAVEGPIGHRFRGFWARPWERTVAHVVPVIVASWALGVIADLVAPRLSQFPEGFAIIPSFIDSVAYAGFRSALLIGIPAVFVVHQFVDPLEEGFEYNAPAALYVAWVVGTAVAFGAF